MRLVLRPLFGGSALVLFALLSAMVLVTGCGTGSKNLATTPVMQARHQGSVYGGSQPIGGAVIQLYTTGTAGDGSPATPLLSSTVTSASDGSFVLTGKYKCPSSSALVYVVATGGNPGLSDGMNNSSLSLMTTIGACGALTPTTFIVVNEVTTVAAVNALSAYMTSAAAVGSGTSDVTQLTSAFAVAASFADSSTGNSPGSSVPAGYTVPVAMINTLADILLTCVNSAGGTAGDGSGCGKLFAMTQPLRRQRPLQIR